MFAKENTLSTKRLPDLDLTDRSVIRSDEAFQKIFAQAGLRLLDVELQTNFPPSLYPVRMYCLSADDLATNLPASD